MSEEIQKIEEKPLEIKVEEKPKSKPFSCQIRQFNPVGYEISVTTPEDVRFVGSIQSRQAITPEIGLKIFHEKYKDFVIDLQEGKDIFIIKN